MKTFTFLAIAFCFIAHSMVWAQAPSDGGRFTVNSTIGCAGFEVVVTDGADAGESIQYIYDFDPDVPEGEQLTETSKTHVYAEPGTYIIRQIQANATPRTDQITIEVVEIEAPQLLVEYCDNFRVNISLLNFGNEDGFYITETRQGVTVTEWSQIPIDDLEPDEQTLVRNYDDASPVQFTFTWLVNSDYSDSGPNANCSATAVTLTPRAEAPVLEPTVINRVDAVEENTVNINFEQNPDLVYDIELSENGVDFFSRGVVYEDRGGAIQFSIPDMDLENNLYCFQMVTSGCSDENPASNIVCIPLLEVVAAQNQNEISWTALDNDNIDSYTLIRTNDGQNLGTFNADAPLEYVDTNVACNVEYSYTVTANYTEGYTATSLPQAVVANADFSSPIENILATIENGNVILTWQTPQDVDAENFNLYSVSQQGDTTVLAEATTESGYTDNLDLSARPCYYVEYLDECGNSSAPSILACPIYLTGTQEENIRNILAWNEYTGWIGGVSRYELERLDEEGNMIDLFNVTGSTTYSDEPPEDRQRNIYRIKATPNSQPGDISYSNELIMEFPVVVFIPNAFTPDGDNLNDIFQADGRFIQSFSMKIFNRWGDMVFFSDNLETGWDGSYQGNPLPPGNYTYKAEALDFTGKSVNRRGTVLLLRNN